MLKYLINQHFVFVDLRCQNDCFQWATQTRYPDNIPLWYVSNPLMTIITNKLRFRNDQEFPYSGYFT